MLTVDDKISRFEYSDPGFVMYPVGTYGVRARSTPCAATMCCTFKMPSGEEAGVDVDVEIPDGGGLPALKLSAAEEGDLLFFDGFPYPCAFYCHPFPDDETEGRHVVRLWLGTYHMAGIADVERVPQHRAYECDYLSADGSGPKKLKFIVTVTEDVIEVRVDDNREERGFSIKIDDCAGDFTRARSISITSRNDVSSPTVSISFWTMDKII